MKKKKTLFLVKWEEANKLLKEGMLKEADEALDWCILLLAKATLRGEKSYCGDKVDLWKMRVWGLIEETGLLPE
jgi:hypothetical protein